MSLRYSYQSFLFILYFVLLSFSSSSHAAPSGIDRYEETVARRQDSNQQPVTFTTVSEKNTPSGVVKETCVITLTPITVNGQSQVQEVKQCTVSQGTGDPDGGSGLPGASQATGASTTDSVSSTATFSASPSETSSSTSSQQTSSTPSATSPAASSSVSSSVTPTGLDTSASTSSTSSVSSTSVSGSATPAVSVNGVSTVSASSTSSTASTSGSAVVKPAVSVNGISTVPPSPIPTPTPTSPTTTHSSTSTSPPSTGIAAGDQAPASSSGSAAAVNTSGFTIPGKKLSVLPIGLGVFAGISVIALIVVGLVTYERTKYRKAFRQRRLAETGAAMAYGGMAQRV